MAENTKTDPTTVQVRPVRFVNAEGKQVVVEHRMTKHLDLTLPSIKPA